MADPQGIIVHFDGFHVSIYFTTFPAPYLQTLHTDNIDLLRCLPSPPKLDHTHRYNLINTADRTSFICEFVALLRFVASGDAGIGFLRKDCGVIHRNVGTAVDEEGEVRRPPQEDLDRRRRFGGLGMLRGILVEFLHRLFLEHW